MTAAELLTEVKNRIGVTGDYHDTALSGYIEDVKYYLIDAGATNAKVNSHAAVGVIARGVSDLWNYGAGPAAFSPYFYQRATQLIYSAEPESEGENEAV